MFTKSAGAGAQTHITVSGRELKQVSVRRQSVMLLQACELEDDTETQTPLARAKAKAGSDPGSLVLAAPRGHQLIELPLGPEAETLLVQAERLIMAPTETRMTMRETASGRMMELVNTTRRSQRVLIHGLPSTLYVEAAADDRISTETGQVLAMTGEAAVNKTEISPDQPTLELGHGAFVVEPGPASEAARP